MLIDVENAYRIEILDYLPTGTMLIPLVPFRLVRILLPCTVTTAKYMREESITAGIGTNSSSPRLRYNGAAWAMPAQVPLDRDGPVSVPFELPPKDFVERPIYELFEAIATRDPSAPALADNNRRQTYAEVRSAVRRLAREIATQTSAGDAVAVLLPNVPESIVCVLACLAVGRCCLVLNADHPAERNAAILRDADVHAVVIKDHAGAEGSLVSGNVARIVIADTEGDVAEQQGDVAELPRCLAVGPDDPAIVLYTSGSTGQPKGIVLSQSTILARVRNNIVSMHLNRGDHFLSLGALGTTAGLVASVVALLGGSMQFIMSAAASGASPLISLIRDERVTILWGVPALLRLLFEVDGARDALASLRVVRTFGDRLLCTDLRQWRSVLPNTCHVAVTYGQTEVTAAQWFVPATFTFNEAALPTGYLLPEHEFAIVDEHGAPVGDGEIGELILRSRFIALGAWERGRCTVGRTRPDPHDRRLRILRTGDLVRLRQDNLLQVVGRCDRQVKIRGQRVEPAEIEDVLRRVSGVTDAAIAVQRNAEAASLFGFVVADNPHDTSILDRARKAVRDLLPNYMHPKRILLANRLPLLPGGKVDAQALLKIAEAETGGTSTEPAVPARATADSRRAMETAWRRVLGSKPKPGVTFLDMAGDSLRLMELVCALEGLVGRQLPLDAFNAETTAGQMALALDSALRYRVAPTHHKVFLLPGARGDTPGLAALRADCMPEVSMQMVTYPDWREMLRAGAKLEGIAEVALSQIRATSPEGPLCLVGYSFGVHVAFVIACALESEGRQVAQLVSIDMPPPNKCDRDTPAWSAHTMTREIWWEIDRFRRAAQQGMAAERMGMIVAPFAVRMVRSWGLRTITATNGLSRYFGDFGYWTEHHMGQEFRLRANREWALRWRAPVKRLRAPVLLIRSAEHREDASEDLGWSELAEQVRVVQVQGTHVSMLSAAHRRTVSDAVGVALARALSEPDGAGNRVSAALG